MTIIHGGDQLLNDTYPLKFRKTITKKVADRGINLILGDHVESIPAEGSVGLTTQHGKRLPDADLVVSTYPPVLYPPTD